MGLEDNNWFSSYYAKVETFWASVSIADENKVAYLLNRFQEAVQQNDEDAVELLVDVAFQIENQEIMIEALNRLLLLDGHYQHQMITKTLQDIGHPSSVEFIAQVLELDFKRFAYTASEDGVIAKWFSHALADIGTVEATALLKRYAQSENQEIATEMQYRLRRIEEYKTSPPKVVKSKTSVFKNIIEALKKL